MAAGRDNEAHILRVFGLGFLGSLAYLLIVALSSGGSYQFAAWAGASWNVVAYLVAAVGAIALFLLSFTNLFGIREETVVLSLFITVLVGVSLVALTFGNHPMLLVVLIGFVLSFTSGGVAHHARLKKRNRREVAFDAEVRKRKFFFEFLASIVYLLITFTAIGGAYYYAMLSAAPLEPLLFSAAMIGAIALFFISFINLGAFSNMNRGAWLVGGLTGFILLSITLGNNLYFLLSLFGFALAAIGSGGYRN